MKLSNCISIFILIFLLVIGCSEGSQFKGRSEKSGFILNQSKIDSCLIQILSSFDSCYLNKDSIIYLLYLEKQNADSVTFLITSTKTLQSICFNYLPCKFLFINNKLVLYFDEQSLTGFLQRDDNNTVYGVSVESIITRLKTISSCDSYIDRVKFELNKLETEALVRREFKWRIIYSKLNINIQKYNVNSSLFNPNFKLKYFKFSPIKLKSEY